MTFKTFQDALDWARTNGNDHVWPFQRWRIVKAGDAFKVAIVNINSGNTEGFIHA